MSDEVDAIEVLTRRIEHVEGVIDDVVHQLRDVQRRRALLLSTLTEQRKECNRYRKRLAACDKENERLHQSALTAESRLIEVTKYVETSLRTSNIPDDVRVWFTHIMKLIQP